jgi:1-deoxy-D-xylulose-5-phosphate reductoisomerase
MPASPRRVRTAIVGLGFGAEFIPIHQRHPHAELVAICQRSKEKLDQVGKAHGVERRYQSYADVLKDKDVDAVHINSPIPDHAAMSIAALEAGKTVALANKETLVMAGPLALQLAERTGGRIVPVDSEHSAIHQALRTGSSNEVTRIVLTASGGPFRTRLPETLMHVTPEEALKHPTWSMGPKITIDSATMMNKALELIEARWLFGLPATKLAVLVHPQSIVHSMVEFVDGSVIAQLSPPDMRLPIQYALSYPERCDGPTRRFDFTQALSLDFAAPDPARFPALRLGHEAAARGGTAGAVLNAANEEAVRGFLDGVIKFTDIAEVCARVLDEHPFQPDPSLDDVRRLDGWARQEVVKWACV